MPHSTLSVLGYDVRKTVWVTNLVTAAGYLHRRPASEPSRCSLGERELLPAATI